MYHKMASLSSGVNPGDNPLLVGRGKPRFGQAAGRKGGKAMTETFVPEERPKFVEDEHLEYLDDLRDSGVVNIFGAAPYLREMYPELSKAESHQTLGYWMKTFGERRHDDLQRNTFG